MSPIEYIKEGIMKGSWETVCDGYERLTGQSLPIPRIVVETIPTADGALRQIVNIATSILDEPIAEICTTPTKKKRGRPKANKKKNTTVDDQDSSIQLDDNKKTLVQKETGSTQFVTNDVDPEELATNKIKAAKSRQNKAKINRTAPTLYQVKCNECDTEFKSIRKSGQMGQKCSKCLGDKKSRFS